MQKRSLFPPLMKLLTALFALLTLLLFWLNDFQIHGSLGACAITALTIFYHFAMRLAVGALVPARQDPQARWFSVRPWEQRLYRWLRLKKWKKYIPTYDPGSFSLAEHSPRQILETMCRSEVVHEVIVVCSFLPILLSLFWGEFFVFLFTSIAAGLVDLVFVALQRYNRPRVQRLLEKQSSQGSLA